MTAPWIDREVAYAGNCLYDRESSYTGLITLDPVDPRIAVISTDVDPQNGELLGHHEIYRATIERKDDVGQVRWQAITQDSPVDNLRPVILYHGDRRIILWNRGDLRTYTDYQLDTVGVIE
ncbi:MAG: hypothetical protein ACI8W8_000738 [Rhodothermales bacterium]|jgi:hypothetical protein